jgi:hypothetical protein
MARKTSLIRAERIERAILLIRGQKVMLDEDLARLYEVETKALNQAVKRNGDRFPKDFAFQLTKQEWKALRSQTVTSKDRGGRRYPPYVFTEQGVAMLSSVLPWSMSRLCVHLYDFDESSRHIRPWQRSSHRSRGNTTSSSRWCLTSSVS